MKKRELKMCDSIKKYRNLAEQMLRQVLTEENLKEMNDTIENRACFATKYAKGGLSIHRGFFNPAGLRKLL